MAVLTMKQVRAVQCVQHTGMYKDTQVSPVTAQLSSMHRQLQIWVRLFVEQLLPIGSGEVSISISPIHREVCDVQIWVPLISAWIPMSGCFSVGVIFLCCCC